MIVFARADARRFRAAARRCAPTGRPRGPAPPVRITAAGDAVTLAAHLGEVVVALTTPAAGRGSGAVTLSLAALEPFEAAGPGAVTLEVGCRRGAAVTARWEDGAVPRTADLEVTEADLAWPEEPASLAPVAPHFLAALHEAGRTAARESDKYAVTRVQVRGKAGQVIGTDGKQALVQGGFTFPFEDDMLVPAVPVFGSKDLAAQSTVGVGLAGPWLCVAAGPWRVWLLVDREGRFPDVHAAVPRAGGTRLAVADQDAEALLAALPGLPGAGGPGCPVTLDLGPDVVVRARDDGGPVAQIPLPDSVAVGPPVRAVLSRDHLGRAVALGFREFRVPGPGRPVTARAGDRLYLAAALDPSCAVAPDPSPDTPLPPRKTPVPTRDTPPPDRNGHADPPAGEWTDPMAEAEALRSALAEAAARAARLVTTLKQFRRERRALATAWSSLKQLNLGP